MDKIELRKQIIYRYDSLIKYTNKHNLNYTQFCNWLKDKVNYSLAKTICEKEFKDVK